MLSFEAALRHYLSRLERAQKTGFVCAMIWGMIAHLQIFSSGLFFHDAAYIDTLGSGTSSGRWMISLMQMICDRLTGTFELPFLNGFVSILLIAVSAMVVISCLGVKSSLTGAYIGSVMVVFPVVSSMFAYMFTAPIYCLSLLLSVLSVKITDGCRSFPAFAASACALAVSMGIYQAFFPAAVTLLLVSLFLNFGSFGSAGVLIKTALYRLSAVVAGLVLYFAIAKLTIAALPEALGGYQGINNMGSLNLSKLPLLIKRLNAEFFLCTWSGINNTFFEKTLSKLLLVLSCAFAACFIFTDKASKQEKLLALLMLLLMPTAMNLIFLMSTDDNYEIHTLMRYSLCFFYIVPACLLGIIESRAGESRGRIPAKIKTGVCVLTALLLWCVPCVHTYTDNVAYLKMSFIQEQTVSYYTSMVTRIRSAEGYTDGMPVAFVGNKYYRYDADLTVLPMEDQVKLHGYDESLTSAISDWSWRQFLPLHTGFDAELLVDTTELAQTEQVQSMPCYPSNGSIKVIDDTVVVKLTD